MVALSVLAIQRWKVLSTPLRIVAVWIFFSLFIELGASYARQVYRNNLAWYHAYTLGELLLLSAFYSMILDKKSFIRRYFVPLTAAFIFLVVFNSLFIQVFDTLNSYSKSLVQIVLIWYAVDFAFTFWDDHDKPFYYNELRLINSGALFYYCGSLFIFLFSSLVPLNEDGYYWMWDLNMVLLIIFLSMVFLALYRTGTK
ncbi:MAG: hypothetical protein IT270_05485 [Saprospiraceae bacterium]|nr:hypothetical protein [Saprospiraceae bacterium]